jgi:CheY-like chemotaxis protein
VAAVVATDVKMPNQDGLEVARALAADPRTAHVPLIAVSAMADRQTCLQAGCHDVVEKPFDLDDLVAVVRSCPRDDASGQTPRFEVVG